MTLFVTGWVSLCKKVHIKKLIKKVIKLSTADKKLQSLNQVVGPHVHILLSILTASEFLIGIFMITRLKYRQSFRLIFITYNVKNEYRNSLTKNVTLKVIKVITFLFKKNC